MRLIALVVTPFQWVIWVRVAWMCLVDKDSTRLLSGTELSWSNTPMPMSRDKGSSPKDGLFWQKHWAYNRPKFKQLGDLWTPPCSNSTGSSGR